MASLRIAIEQFAKGAGFVVVAWFADPAVSGRYIRLVRKLREARERSGTLGGRKPYAEAMPATVARAKELHAQGLSLRKISAALFEEGHMTGGRKRHVASAV